MNKTVTCPHCNKKQQVPIFDEQATVQYVGQDRTEWIGFSCDHCKQDFEYIGRAGANLTRKPPKPA